MSFVNGPQHHKASALVLGVDDRVADVFGEQRVVPADRGDGLPRAPHLRPLRHLEQARRPVPPPHGATRLLQQASQRERKTACSKTFFQVKDQWTIHTGNR